MALYLVCWGKVWIAALGLGTGNHHVEMNIFLLVNSYTHMIDNFLFSNPTAQFGGWQGIIIRSSLCLLTFVSCAFIAKQKSAIRHFFLFESNAVQPFWLSPAPAAHAWCFNHGVKAPCVGGLKHI